MASDVLVQTVLPPQLGKWVKHQAEAAGLSTAAWVRRLIMQSKAQLVVKAWAMPRGQRRENSPQWYSGTWTSRPYLFLERAAVHPDGTVEFRAFDINGPPGTPLLASRLHSDYFDLRQELNEGWLVLDGSYDPWIIVRQVADANAGGQIVLFLRTERAAA